MVPQPGIWWLALGAEAETTASYFQFCISLKGFSAANTTQPEVPLLDDDSQMLRELRKPGLCEHHRSSVASGKGFSGA